MDIFAGNYLDYLLRLVIAALIGGAVGVEREIRGKPAGMRTNILLCTGSCLIMILSVEVAENTGKMADPGRIAAQVVTGIGFLGAGTIIRSRVSVSGLTSAATLWFVAALGLVVGYGSYLIAVTASLLMITTLTTFKTLERKIEVSRELHVVRLRIPTDGKSASLVHRVLIRHRVSPDEINIKDEEAAVVFHIEYVAREKKHKQILSGFLSLDGVEILLDY
jgi:putative Mg2+ transporter-C (MgtC) family protein